MKAQLEKVREAQRKLGKCAKYIADPQKKQRFYELIHELHQMEQNMLFKNVLSLEPIKTPNKYTHLTKEQTNLRVIVEQNKDKVQIVRDLVGSNPENQALVAEMEIQREDAEKLSHFHRLAASLLEMPTISKELIHDLVEQDESISLKLKKTLEDELVEKLLG